MAATVFARKQRSVILSTLNPIHSWHVECQVRDWQCHFALMCKHKADSTSRLSRRLSNPTKSYQNGTLTVHLADKLKVTIPMFISVLLQSSRIQCVVGKISWSCVSAGIMMALPTNSTSDMTPPARWKPTRTSSRGSVWSKNIHY